jgi:hypothetical protein
MVMTKAYFKIFGHSIEDMVCGVDFLDAQLSILKQLTNCRDLEVLDMFSISRDDSCTYRGAEFAKVVYKCTVVEMASSLIATVVLNLELVVTVNDE